MNLKIKNRTALIIGASKNIGRNISITLAKEKVSLIMVARSKEKLTKLKIEVDKYSTNNLIIQSDLSIKGNINKLINKINKKYKNSILSNKWNLILKTFISYKIKVEIMIRAMLILMIIFPAIKLKGIIANNKPKKFDFVKLSFEIKCILFKLW